MAKRPAGRLRMGQGARCDDPSLPKLEAVTLGPAKVTLDKGAEQPVSATAVYADGSQQDVTRLATFRSSDPAEACTDEVFLRRVFLDLTGTLPTPGEARAFLSDSSRDKRGQLIEDLFEREEFVAFWALKWGDLLRVKAENPVSLWPKGAETYCQWVYESIAENKPYDQFARWLTAPDNPWFARNIVNRVRYWLPGRGIVHEPDDTRSTNLPENPASATATTISGARCSWPGAWRSTECRRSASSPPEESSARTASVTAGTCTSRSMPPSRRFARCSIRRCPRCWRTSPPAGC